MASYSYSPVERRDGADSIRLLCLLPNDDENAMIECQLFNFLLPSSDKGTHLYEALSYVWGIPNNNHSITEEILIAAAENFYGHELLRLFINDRGDEVRITPQLLNAAARSDSGDETIRLLLEQRGDQVNITEELVKAAAGNETCETEIIRLLLDRRGDEIEITEEVVRATCADHLSINRAHTMSLLLDRLGDAASIPDEVIRAIPKDWDSKEKIREYIRSKLESWLRKMQGKICE
jgi:hypothetical protein